MRLVLSAVLVLAAVAAAPSWAAPAELSATRTFEAWTATCDNLRDCVAIGSSDDGDGLFYVRITRPAAAGATIKVVLAASEPIPGVPGTLQLVLRDGARKTSDTFAAAARKADPDGDALAADVVDPAFLTALEHADTLDYAAGMLKGRLALKGLTSALRFLDEHQGRAGTPTALIAHGTNPFVPVSPPPSVPVVRPAALVASVVGSPALSRALLDMARPACDPEVVEAHSDAAAWTLGPDRRLVAVPCAESPYNVTVALFTTDAKGEQPRPAMLEQPPRQGDAEADNVVVNSAFDVATLTLTSLDKGRALGDCGAARSWVWTGDIFALLQATQLEACPGALPEDWPAVFTATRK